MNSRNLYLCGILSLAFFPGAALLPLDLEISEFMASNGGVLLDRDGDSSDWVEVHNTTAFPVDLDGWFLTDAAGEPKKWVFPRRRLGPDEYLVVFASGKDQSPVDGELHTNFKLDSVGEYLALFAPDGVTVATEFTPAYPPQQANLSYGSGQSVSEVFVAEGDAARIHVPSSAALGRSWTGGDEPFSDSAAAGWNPVTIGVGFPAGAGGEAPPPQAYWSFDGNALDATPGRHDGQILGGATFSPDVPPSIGSGQSLRFDGADDYVSVEIDVSETNYTVSFWFKANRGSRGLFVVTDSNLGVGGHDRHLYLAGNNISSRVWNNETIGSTGRNYVDGNWHHVAHVVGPEIGGQRIYVDGQLVANGAKAFSDFDWQRRIHFGFSNDAATDFLDGYIDDAAIWEAALSAADVAALAAGGDPLALGGFSSFVQTDIAGRMQGENASVYLRIPFTVNSLGNPDLLQLRMRYDDGFIAYLNGEEVARRNAPAVAGFDAAATVDRPLVSARRTEFIDLTAFAGLLREGANVLAIHGLNDAPDGEDFLISSSLVTAERSVAYIRTPTPGAPNTGGTYDGFVGAIELSHPRGFYDAPFELRFHSAVEGVEIRYSLDGSEPTQTNGLVHDGGPILVSRTLTLRVAGFRDGWIPAPVQTHSYLFVEDIIEQPDMRRTITRHPVYGPLMDDALLGIPSVCIAISGTVTTREREASIELVHPDGRKGFQIAAGIKRVGGHSLNAYPKNNMRLYFRSEYGRAKLKYPLFAGLPYGDSAIKSFDRLQLRSGSHDSVFYLGSNQQPPSNAQYLRNRWMNDIQFEMGRMSLHGRFVHVYINGTYWGHYQLMERPSPGFMASKMGGAKKDYEAINSGNPPRVVGNDYPAWRKIRTIRNDYAETRRWVDVENLTDYMLLNYYAGNAWDWTIHHNWMAGGPSFADGGGYKFFSWDADIVLRRTEDFNLNQGGPDNLFRDLLQHDEFRLLVADRINALFHNDGLLTPKRVQEIYDRRAQEIRTTIVPETARWQWTGSWTRDVQWVAEWNRLRNDFFPRRTDIVIQQLRSRGFYPGVEAPVFRVEGVLQHGGEVNEGDRLSILIPDGGSFVESPLVDLQSKVHAHVPSDNAMGDRWRELSYAEGSEGESWKTGTNGVGYENGSGYQDAIQIDVGAEMSGATGNNTVYVRIPFTVPDRATLNAVDRLALRMSYDDGFAAYLNGVPVAARSAPAEGPLTWNSNATTGGETDLASPEEIDITEFVGELRFGANLLAIHGLNFATSSSDMLIRAELVVGTFDPDAASGDILYTRDGSDPREPGATSYTGSFALEQTTLVKARARDGDTWSALAEALFVIPNAIPLRVTEIHYHPVNPDPPSPFGDNDFEFIELRNIGARALSLAGVSLTGDIEFDFTGAGVASLDPLEYVVVVEDPAAFSLRYDTAGVKIAGQYRGDLGNSGGLIRLVGPLGETLQRFIFSDTWQPTTDGQGDSLTVVDEFGPLETWSEAEGWVASSVVHGTPGFSDRDGGTPSGWQLPGDANQDRHLDIGDAFSILLLLFRGEVIDLPCDAPGLDEGGNRDLLDLNGDTLVNTSDAVHLLVYLFLDGGGPASGLDCVRIESCTNLCVR